MRLRKEKGLSQQDLADLLDVQPRLVGRWEQGQGKPQFDYLVKLAEVLEVSLDRLLRGEGATLTAPDIRNRKLKELCRRVDQLKSEDQEVICHFLDLAVRHDQLRQLVERPLPQSLDSVEDLPMQTAKETAKQVIDRLPDQASWDDILYELYVKQKIEAGLATMTEGKTVTHEDAKRRLLDG